MKATTSKYVLVGIISLVAWAFLASGCYSILPFQAKGPVFSGLPSPPPGKATLVFFRLKSLAMAGAYPYVYIDEAKRGPLYNGGYLVYHVPPGRHNIDIKGPRLHWDPSLNASGPIDVEAGKTYFIGFQIGGDIESFTYRVHFQLNTELVPPDVALPSLRNLRLCE